MSHMAPRDEKLGLAKLIAIGSLTPAEISAANDTGSPLWPIILGLGLMTTTVELLIVYLWNTRQITLVVTGTLYVAVVLAQQSYQHFVQRT